MENTSEIITMFLDWQDQHPFDHFDNLDNETIGIRFAEAFEGIKKGCDGDNQLESTSNCTINSVSPRLLSNEDIDKEFPVDSRMMSHTLERQKGKRIGAKWMRNEMLNEG